MLLQFQQDAAIPNTFHVDVMTLLALCEGKHRWLADSHHKSLKSFFMENKEPHMLHSDNITADYLAI